MKNRFKTLIKWKNNYQDAHTQFINCRYSHICVTDKSMLDTIALSAALQDNRICNQTEVNWYDRLMNVTAIINGIWSISPIMHLTRANFSMSTYLVKGYNIISHYILHIRNKKKILFSFVSK